MNTLLLQLVLLNFYMLRFLFCGYWYGFDLFYCNIEEFDDFIFLILVEYYWLWFITVLECLIIFCIQILICWILGLLYFLFKDQLFMHQSNNIFMNKLFSCICKRNLIPSDFIWSYLINSWRRFDYLNIFEILHVSFLLAIWIHTFNLS